MFLFQLLKTTPLIKLDPEDLELYRYRSAGINQWGYITIIHLGKTQCLHKVILGELVLEVDHENGDKLDYHKTNLRKVTHQQNSFNKGPNVNNKTGYKGVSYYKAGNKWQASIKVNGKSKHLGHHSSPEKAALAYNAAARLYFGEHAHINVIQESK